VIKVTLRHVRTEVVVGLAVLIGLAVVLAVTGAHLVAVNDSFLRTCQHAGGCSSAGNPVLDTETPLQGALPFVVIVAPALAGLFLGAPLVARELESGTFRLAWTQSVSRRRWLAVKLGVVGAAATAFATLVTWMVDWWASPIEAVNQSRFGLGSFSLQGVAPIGYAAFAFALGVTSGILLRRTVAAMALTAAGFAAARLAVTYWVRPNLAAPVRASMPLPTDVGPKGPGFGFDAPGVVTLTPAPPDIPNAWVYSTSVVDRAGHAPSSQFLMHACPVLGQVSRQLGGSGGKPSAVPAGPGNFQACAHTLAASLHLVVLLQPASRFWPFQWAEMGIFFAAAAALCGLADWFLRRRYG